MLGIQGGLPDDEPPARGDDVRPSLLGGVQTFFLTVIRWRSKNRQIVVWPTRMPCRAANSARISASVKSD